MLIAMQRPLLSLGKSITGIMLSLSLTPLSHANLLEEIVVTAQKREQSVFDVGIAISSYSGEQIDRLGYTDSTQVTALAPGVDYSAGGGGQNRQFVIRGVNLNEFNETVEGTTAVYLDEGYDANIGSGIFALFDLERVEILKGPQGTLFGRNATGGLVHYVTRKPTDELEGYADITYGSYDNINFQGAISGSLSEQVRARSSVYYNRHDSIFENIYPAGAPAGSIGGLLPGGGQDHWNDDTVAGRLQFEFDLNQDATLYVMGHGYRMTQGENPYQQVPTMAVFDDNGTIIDVIHVRPQETRSAICPPSLITAGTQPLCSTPRPVPGGDFFGYIDPDGEDLLISKDWAFDDKAEFDFYGFNAKLDWQINDLKLETISDYKKHNRFQTTDVDSGPGNQLVYAQDTDSWQFSQELRLSTENERSRWVAGLYYLHIDAGFINGFIIPSGSIFIPFGAFFGIPGNVPFDAPNDINLETNSYSIFGQFEIDLTDDLTFIAGVRVIQEEKDFRLSSTANVSNDFFRHDLEDPTFRFPTSQEDPSGAPYMESTSDTLWAGKAQLDWKPNDDWLIYGSINRGVKAGNFNSSLPIAGVALAADDIGYKPETLLAYEVGFKAAVFNGKARLSGALYHYDYSNYHTFAFIGISSIVTNQEAKNTGIELELVTEPFEGFSLLLGASAFDFVVKDVAVQPGLVRDEVEPQYAPRFTWSGLARYEWPMWGGSLAIQLDTSYRSKVYNNINNFSANKLPSTHVGNARISYLTADSKWDYSFFVNNIANARNQVIGFDLATLCGCNDIAHEKPRWFGASIRYNF